MQARNISCLLFMLLLTSLCSSDGIVSSSLPLKQENAAREDLFLSFQSIKKLADSPSEEEIIEEVKELMPNITYYLHIEEVPFWVNFVVFQTHAYLHNVTLGYNIEKVPHRYVTGQNVGLVQNITASGPPQFFLDNINPFNVTVLIAVIAYSKTVPMPGGCNMEFEVETAPWLVVNVTGPMVVVSSQPARPPRVIGLGDVCDMPSLHYQAYHRYLPEQDFTQPVYFDYVRSMISVARVQQNGKKVKDSMLGQMRHAYSVYHGTGTVYAVVVTDNSGSAAAYVPALTYACNPACYTDSCQVLGSMFSRTLCALTLFLGLFICFFGHSFFQTELFLFTTLMGSIVFYVVVAPLALSDSTNVVLATVGGVTVANFWLVLWWALGSPLLSIIMATLALGFLSTSVLFYTLLADLPMLESNGVYWLGFLCCMLVVAVLVTPQVTRVNLLSCALVGSYAAIVPVDHYVGSNLKYIFINTMRRATVSGFNEAIIDPPFQTKDYVLLLVWVVLAAIGYTMQAQRFADKPMFPRLDHHAWLSPAQSFAHLPRVNERRPLLADIDRLGASSPGSDSVFS